MEAYRLEDSGEVPLLLRLESSLMSAQEEEPFQVQQYMEEECTVHQRMEECKVHRCMEECKVYQFMEEFKVHRCMECKVHHTEKELEL